MRWTWWLPCGPFAGIESAFNQVPISRPRRRRHQEFLPGRLVLASRADRRADHHAGAARNFNRNVLGRSRHPEKHPQAWVTPRKNKNLKNLPRHRPNDGQVDAIFAQGLLPVRRHEGGDSIKSRRKCRSKLEEIDVDGSRELREKFADQVPVLFIDGRKAFKYRVTRQTAGKEAQPKTAKTLHRDRWFLGKGGTHENTSCCNCSCCC